jgi:parafibromin
MLKSIDPLLYLRDNIQQNKIINRDKDYLVFEDGTRLPITTPTALIQNTNQTQYNLGSLWFYLKHREDSLAVYHRECFNQGMQFVIGLDKEKIADYFLRNVDIDLIDNDLRPKTFIYLGKKKKGESFSELYKNENNENNINLNENKKKQETKFTNRKKEELSDPKLLIMDYIYLNEKKSLNHNSMLKPVDNIQSYENLLTFCKKIFLKDGNVSHHHETLTFLDELLNSDDLQGNKAIIVVPTSFVEGNLSCENAKEFLCNANYINMKTCSEEERNRCMKDSLKNTFTKKILDKDILFEITSNVRNFTKIEWKRVVSVFVQGDDWEFKDWPKSENPTSILQKVKGFYLKFQDMPVNENTKKWNVKILEISRSKRYYDVSIQNEFWNLLTDFLNQPRKR